MSMGKNYPPTTTPRNWVRKTFVFSYINPVRLKSLRRIMVEVGYPDVSPLFLYLQFFLLIDASITVFIYVSCLFFVN